MRTRPTSTNAQQRSQKRRGRIVGALIGSLLFSPGCAAFRPLRGVPASHVPDELLGPSREGRRTINLSLLVRRPVDQYRLEGGDILAVYIPGLLGTRNLLGPALGRETVGESPPITAPANTIDPPAMGYPITIRDDHTLVLPQLAPINVFGMTLREAELAIANACRDAQLIQMNNSQILVSLWRPREYRVMVVRQESTATAATGSGMGTVNPGVTKKGSGQVVRLRSYENDVLHALTESVGGNNGLPGLDAENAIYIIRRSKAHGACPAVAVAPPHVPMGPAGMDGYHGMRDIPAAPPVEMSIPQSPRVAPPVMVQQAPPTNMVAPVPPAAPARTGGPAFEHMSPSAPAAQGYSPGYAQRGSGGTPFQHFEVNAPQQNSDSQYSAPPQQPQSDPQYDAGPPPAADYQSPIKAYVPPERIQYGTPQNGMPIVPQSFQVIRGQNPQQSRASRIREELLGGHSTSPVAHTVNRADTTVDVRTAEYGRRDENSTAVQQVTTAYGPQAGYGAPPVQSYNGPPSWNMGPQGQVPYVDPNTVGMDPHSGNWSNQPGPAASNPYSVGYGNAMPAPAFESLPQSGPTCHPGTPIAGLFPQQFNYEDLTIDSPNVIRIPVRVGPGESPNINEEDIVLYDGDIVFIESRDTEVFYTGGLLGGGEYMLPRDRDLHVTEAISVATSRVGAGGGGTMSSSGGVSALNGDVTISPSRVIVRRRLDNGQIVPIEVDIYRARLKPEEDIIIQPRDLILLQYKCGEATLAFIERHLLAGALFGVAAASLTTGSSGK